MAAKTPTQRQTKARAKAVASGGTAVRDRVRKLSVSAFRDRKLSLRDVSKLVHEVLEGAVEGVDASIPKSSRNVLRGVFDGLSDGVHTIASAGSAAIRDARDRAGAGRNVSSATKRIRAANDEFLGAVKSFARKTSAQVREELDALVARAEWTGPKVADSARKAAKAADGRLIELSGETARAGVRAARLGAAALASGASGFLEGLSEAITPRGRPTDAKRPKRAAVPKAKKKRTGKRSPKGAATSRRA